MARFVVGPLYLGILLAFLPIFAAASISIDCSVNTNIDVRIDDIDVDQTIGAERLECSNESSPEVRIVRTVRANTSARASGGARGNASVWARFNWSGNGTGCSQGNCQCTASGSDSRSCSSSDSASDSKTDWEQNKLVVSRATYDQLAAKGFTPAPGPTVGECELKTADGKYVEILKALAIVSWLHGERLAGEHAPELMASPAAYKGGPLPAAAAVKEGLE